MVTQAAKSPLRSRDSDRPWYTFAVRPLPPRPLGRWVDIGCRRGEFIERASGGDASGIGLDCATSGAKHKLRYVVPRAFEPLLARHFVWRLERVAAARAAH